MSPSREHQPFHLSIPLPDGRAHPINMIRKTRPLILINRMLRIRPLRPPHPNLPLDSLDILPRPALQQRMQLHPVFELDFARGVDVGAFEGFAAGVVGGEVGEDGGFGEGTFVVGVEFSEEQPSVSI